MNQTIKLGTPEQMRSISFSRGRCANIYFCHGEVWCQGYLHQTHVLPLYTQWIDGVVFILSLCLPFLCLSVGWSLIVSLSIVVVWFDVCVCMYVCVCMRVCVSACRKLPDWALFTAMVIFASKFRMNIILIILPVIWSALICRLKSLISLYFHFSLSVSLSLTHEDTYHGEIR